MKKLSIVIPVYNEKRWVSELLERVLAADPSGLEKELVVVDDCSTDGTKEILEDHARREPQIKLVRQDKNRGKGAALRRGFAEASGGGVPRWCELGQRQSVEASDLGIDGRSPGRLAGARSRHAGRDGSAEELSERWLTRG